MWGKKKNPDWCVTRGERDRERERDDVMEPIAYVLSFITLAML